MCMLSQVTISLMSVLAVTQRLSRMTENRLSMTAVLAGNMSVPFHLPVMLATKSQILQR